LPADFTLPDDEVLRESTMNHIANGKEETAMKTKTNVRAGGGNGRIH
jgi:hypothetical protein